MAVIKKTVDPGSPGINVMPYMESGCTDGMHFRSAGIPTWAMSSVFMGPDDMFAHGLITFQRLSRQDLSKI